MKETDNQHFEPVHLNDEYWWWTITKYNLLMYCTFTLYFSISVFCCYICAVNYIEGKWMFLLSLCFLHYCICFITLVTSYFSDCQAITYRGKLVLWARYWVRPQYYDYRQRGQHQSQSGHKLFIFISSSDGWLVDSDAFAIEVFIRCITVYVQNNDSGAFTKGAPWRLVRICNSLSATLVLNTKPQMWLYVSCIFMYLQSSGAGS